MGARSATRGRAAAARRTRDDELVGWWTVLALAAALLVILGAVYLRLGWSRMDAVCSTDAAVPPGVSGESVEFGFSMMPFGFTCTWDDVSVTKFWW
ncbi:hypothetical protein SAMN06298212_1484 [Ruaniaceae bacterium KH17]|nr:hypothetical protein SAMN06298212_1484 [Ruaniaceae bacterium KH17]